jgi:hypothetical protein
VSKLSGTDACRRFLSHLSEVISRDVPAELLAEADAHRTACTNCEEEYRLALRVEQGLGLLPELFPGEAPEPQMARMWAVAPALDGASHAEALAFDPTQPVELALGCQDFRDMLGDFVSEELPVGMLLEGVDHASACRPCGDELTAMQSLQDGLRALPEMEPPVNMFASLMARIEAEEAEAAAAAPETEAAKVKKLSGARSKLLPVLG